MKAATCEEEADELGARAISGVDCALVSGLELVWMERFYPIVAFGVPIALLLLGLIGRWVAAGSRPLDQRGPGTARRSLAYGATLMVVLVMVVCMFVGAPREPAPDQTLDEIRVRQQNMTHHFRRAQSDHSLISSARGPRTRIETICLCFWRRGRAVSMSGNPADRIPRFHANA